MSRYSLQQCFVIMSFSRTQALETFYKEGIKRAIRDLGFDCMRADEAPIVKRITEEVERLIREASFVIADLTEEKQNCLYELGYAHGLGKRVFLTARRGTDMAFDVSQFPCIFYDSASELRQQLKEKIKNGVLRTSDRDRPDDPHNGHFGKSALANGRLLTARVLRTYPKGDDLLCNIRVDVIPLPREPPVQGQVLFYVDPSWQEEPYLKMAVDGFATLELKEAAGAFTVGAEADDGKTRLELDLAAIPGAPFTFYPRMVQVLEQPSTRRGR